MAEAVNAPVETVRFLVLDNEDVITADGDDAIQGCVQV